MSKITPLEEGIHESQQTEYHSHLPLGILIENNAVQQDKNGDWVMIGYSRGYTNSKEWFTWMETGYLTDWCITKWKHDTNRDETSSYYRDENKDCIPREYLTIVNKHHRYSRYLFEDDDNFWSEGIVSLKTKDWNPINYYDCSLNGYRRGKIPVKIGKCIQEIRDKGIVSGFYKF
jgi:hypothetical protein